MPDTTNITLNAEFTMNPEQLELMRTLAKEGELTVEQVANRMIRMMMANPKLYRDMDAIAKRRRAAKAAANQE
jgi:hypothetical protein